MPHSPKAHMIGDAKFRARNAPSRAAVRLALLVFGIAAALWVACWLNLREHQLHDTQTRVERPAARLAQDARRELMAVGLSRDRRQKTRQGAASTGNSSLRSPARAANFVIAAFGAERFLEWVIQPESQSISTLPLQRVRAARDSFPQNHPAAIRPIPSRASERHRLPRRVNSRSRSPARRSRGSPAPPTAALAFCYIGASLPTPYFWPAWSS